MAVVADKIGKLLVDAKLITEQQLNEALATVKASKGASRLGSTLVKMGYVPEEKLLAFLAQQYRVPAVDLKMYQNIDPAIIKLVPLELVKKHMVLPLRRVGATLTVAMLDPTNIFALDDLKFRTNYTIEPVIAAETSLIETIKKYYGGGAAGAADAAGAAKSILQAKDYTLSDAPEGDELAALGQAQEGPTVDVEDFDKTVGDALDSVEVAETEQDGGVITGEVEAPIVKLVNGILVNAMKVGASDIHIEPYETVFRIRYRVDGDLQTVMNLPLKVKNAIISRIKIMSKLDIAERRLPQDGRIKLKLGPKKDIDFRVSILPTLFGEKGCLRLLDKSNIQVDKDKLGFDAKQAADLNSALAAPYGMLLVTGPTGSGKTVTLYSCLQAVNTVDVNISTAEDPVEFNFMGINQVLVQPDIGLTFPAALKSFLRQDPDIILIGEIRDFETGEIAIKAAMTGHLVMASLHTNDAPATINRLLNMGIEPFLVASSVILVIAQRLCRRICGGCKEPDPSVTPEVMKKFGMIDADIAGATPMKGKGCDKCNNKGYKGRVALYQMMPITENIRTAILRGASTDELKKITVEEGVRNIRMSGHLKVAQGVTSISEVEGVSVAE
ncbi:MAG: type IV-A pilus assembly ATPase PilB [Nitrospirae bacterium]|nr:MAG: type IV-A pilus assembly ATPase PilB [Nitrospirota bacterium]